MMVVWLLIGWPINDAFLKAVDWHRNELLICGLVILVMMVAWSVVGWLRDDGCFVGDWLAY